jgi:LysM repeat protein
MGEMIAKRAAAWLALGAMPVVTWFLAVAARDGVSRVGGTMPLEAVITTGFATAGALITAYLTLVSLAMAVAAPFGRGHRFTASGRFAPLTWRRVAATALGASLATGVALPALAQTGGGSPVDWTAQAEGAITPAAGESTPETATQDTGTPATPDAPAPPSVIEVFVPSPAAGSGVPDVGSTQHTSPQPELLIAPRSPGLESTAGASRAVVTHTVARGDSLWTITADLLGADATVGEIADSWPRLYAANQELIGADPGLIYAGQVLTVPENLR